MTILRLLFVKEYTHVLIILESRGFSPSETSSRDERQTGTSTWNLNIAQRKQGETLPASQPESWDSGVLASLSESKKIRDTVRSSFRLSLLVKFFLWV